MAKKLVKLDEEEAKMDMSPMIDCVFLLLIFFIVVSAQAEVLPDPEVDPTVASASENQKSNIGRIVVNAYYNDGNITYTDEMTENLPVEELKTYIEKEKKRITDKDPNQPVILHLRCDKGLSWKDIQKVKEAAAAMGINNFNFASYQKSQKN